MLRDIASYLRTLLSNSWFRGFFFLSLISTATTFYTSFHAGFLLPKYALVVLALLPGYAS